MQLTQLCCSSTMARDGRRATLLLLRMQHLIRLTFG
jgi:hypothetical protein